MSSGEGFHRAYQADRAPPPVSVDLERKQSVQQIVATGDRCEHSLDIGPGWSPVCVHWDTLRITVATSFGEIPASTSTLPTRRGSTK